MVHGGRVGRAGYPAAVRYVDGQGYYTVGEVSAAAGVSPQTVRLWERQGTVQSRRTRGGHRLFDEAALRRVQQRVAGRRHRPAHAEPEASQPAEPIADWEVSSTGARLRGARERAGLAQREVAAQAGISRSMLSAIERGETGLTMFVFAKLADVLGLQVSELAPATALGQPIVRAADRPRTVLADGVTWEELAPPRCAMSPALLFVPPGEGSGGHVTFAHEQFVTVLEGVLAFEFAAADGTDTLEPGDGLTIPSGATHAWSNPAEVRTVAVWVAHTPPGAA